MYLMLTYAVPGVLMVALDMWPEYYNTGSPNPLAIVGVMLSIGLAFLFIGRRGMAPRRPDDCVQLRWLSSGSQTKLLIVLVVVALVVFAGGSSNWRYTDQGLSNVGSPLLFVYSIIPTVLRAFVLAYVMLDLRFGTRPADLLRRGLVLSGLFLSANGNVTMLIAFISAIMLVFLSTSRRFFWVSMDGSFKRSGLLYQFTLPLLLVPVMALAWLLGETVKRAQPTAAVLEWLFDRDVLTWLVEMLVGRSSPSYVSALIALDRYAFNLDWGVLVDHLGAPLSSCILRIGQLLLLDILNMQRPDAGSIMRINYHLITPFQFFNEREGTWFLESRAVQHCASGD